MASVIMRPALTTPPSCTRAVAAAAFSCLVLAVGCRPPAPSLTPAAPEGPAAFKAPATGLFLVVWKSRRTLEVYRDGVLLESYPVVFGLQPSGPKRFEGDMRTPEGLYHVTGKRRHPRWRYFIALDYPNDADRAAYRLALRDGRIPVIDNRALSIGGGIGIHGTDHLREQREGVDWTKGCIALSNRDITRLVELVERGTPVLIEP